MTPSEFGVWLEECEEKLWQIARLPEATTVERKMWGAVGEVLDQWEGVNLDGPES